MQARRFITITRVSILLTATMDFFIDFFTTKEEKLEAKFLPCKEVFSKEAQELLLFSEAEKYVFFKLHSTSLLTRKCFVIFF